MRAMAPLLLAFAVLGFTTAPARAQNPEKFERVVPPKAPTVQPKAPTAPPVQRSPIIQELMRKAQAKAQEDGFCATMPQTKAETDDAFYANASAGTEKQFSFRHPLLERKYYCGLRRVTAVVMEKGKRCVLELAWACVGEGACDHGRMKWCDNGKAGYEEVRK